MIETTGNLWNVTYPIDVRVITTNGVVKANGECVMGRGCAKEAKDRYPGLAFKLGHHITEHGNVPHILSTAGDTPIVTMPVKHRWDEKADIMLILQSAKTLKVLADQNGWNRILMPRPGCGNGGLKWEYVKPQLAYILDDRFCVITFEGTHHA